MSLEHISQKIKDKMQMAAGLNAVVKFDFGSDGVIVVDSKQAPPVISQDDRDDTDLILSCTTEVFDGILNGTQDPNIAFMMGKLKVKGNMGLAMKLNSILED